MVPGGSGAPTGAMQNLSNIQLGQQGASLVWGDRQPQFPSLSFFSGTICDSSDVLGDMFVLGTSTRPWLRLLSRELLPGRASREESGSACALVDVDCEL